MATQLFSNNAEAILATSINDTITTIVVDDGSVFTSPTGGDYELLTLHISDGTNEIVKMTARSSNTLTVVRAQEGTSGVAWTDTVTTVSGYNTAGTMSGLFQVDNGGNTKGTNAVNIQQNRTSADQVASGSESIVIGSETKASGTNTVAIGIGTSSTGTGSIGIGITAVSSATYSAAIGRVATASGDYSVSIGEYTDATATEAVAIGRTSKAKGTRDVAVGAANVCNVESDVAIHATSTAYSLDNIVRPSGSSYIYRCVQAGTSGGTPPSWSTTYLVVDGTVLWIPTYPGASRQERVNIGYVNTVGGYNGIAIGTDNINHAEYGISIGFGNDHHSRTGITIGRDNNTFSAYSYNIGYSNEIGFPNTNLYSYYTVCIGYQNKSQLIANTGGIHDYNSWYATTEFSYGDWFLEDETSYGNQNIFYCVKQGTTGSTQPTFTNGTVVTDGTAKWVCLTVSKPGSNSSINIGTYNWVYNGSGIAMGNYVANTNNSIVLGSNVLNLGSNTFIGYGHNVGTANVIIGVMNYNTRGYPEREVYFTSNVSLGANAYVPLSNGGRWIKGTPALPVSDWNYWTDSDSAAQAVRINNNVDEATIFSDYVGIGSGPSWQADTLYKHGDVVFPTTPNGYSYYAYCYNVSAYDTCYSGSTEPTPWPTVVGDSAYDENTGLNDPDWKWIDWVCMSTVQHVVFPDYSRFFPIEFGFITKDDTDSPPSGNAYLSMGSTSAATEFVTSTQFDKLTGPHRMQIVSVPEANRFGTKYIYFKIQTRGTGKINGRFFVKGYCLQTTEV